METLNISSVGNFIHDVTNNYVKVDWSPWCGQNSLGIWQICCSRKSLFVQILEVKYCHQILK